MNEHKQNRDRLIDSRMTAKEGGQGVEGLCKKEK